MNQFFTNLQKEARALRLTSDEKQRMRVNLYEAMRTSVPFVAPTVPSTRRVPSPYHFFSIRLMVPVCAVLIVVLGGGTAFAAQGALPGDALYTIKINVNEQVQSALAISDTSKLEVHAGLAQKRLEEAETLAASGKLTASTSAALAQNFDQHFTVSQNLASALSAEDPDAAVELTAQIDSSIAAHGAILAQLGDDSDSEKIKEDSNLLANHVRSRSRREDVVVIAANASDTVVATLTMEVKPQTFVATAPAQVQFAAKVASSAPAPSTTSNSQSSKSKKPETPSKQQTAVLRLQVQASTTLTLAHKDLLLIQKSLDASTMAQVQSQFSLIEGIMQEGSSSLAIGDYAGASASFTDVVRIATRLDTYLKAGKKFNKKILSSLLTTLSSQQDKKVEDSDSKGSSSNKGKSDPTNQVLGTTTTLTASSSSETHTEIEGKGKGQSDTTKDTSSSTQQGSFLHTLLKNL